VDSGQWRRIVLETAKHFTDRLPGAKGEASALDCPEDRRQFLDCVVDCESRDRTWADSGLPVGFWQRTRQMLLKINYLGIESMAGPGRTFGSVNVRSEKPFATALRMELAAAGDSHRQLRLIARNLITLARAGEPGALQAIREIADRLDGKPKQEAEVTLRQALARELSDDDLAAIALGAGNEEVEADSNPASSKLN
jgi:hypothetical protein